MPITETVTSDQLVDSAIGAIKVQTAEVTGFDIDDFVSGTVVSTATAIQIYNMALNVDPAFAKDRRKVDINGVSVGGY